MNCAQHYLGAWWYKSCHHSNLFGMYFGGTFSSSLDNKGMVWRHWRGGLYSYKSIKMMVRPKCRCA
ncbi:uncharacterized protein Dwil_GK15354 [Drosophila willistoni]|uniref:Fibrinogen C-terminal domain-containing protein n=2 Tax=Drosophila willistoni TaxID=7260 RepID=B4MUQ0_DROWI|nr:uncharacterized protein Dwil_GK15354 [Drosophila willistoni]